MSRIFRNSVESVGDRAPLLVSLISEEHADWCEQFSQEGYTVFHVVYPSSSLASLAAALQAAAEFIRPSGRDWGLLTYALLQDDVMTIPSLLKESGLDTLKACVHFNPLSENGESVLIRDAHGKLIPTVVHVSSAQEMLHASLQLLVTPDEQARNASLSQPPAVAIHSYPKVPSFPPFPFLTKAPASIIAGEKSSVDPYVRSATSLAHSRTLELLKRRLGPYYDLEQLWEKHTYYEFVERDAPKTISTMVDTPYVNHVPNMTGGVGHDDLTRFYKYHFTQVSPPDTEMITVSRTVGADRIIDEMIFKCTHTTEVDYLLPGVKPTGKPFEIALVGVVAFRGDKLTFEHLYWDQASLLVQIGLLDPRNLPVTGVEAARKVLDPFGMLSNTLMTRWAESEGLSLD